MARRNSRSKNPVPETGMNCYVPQYFAPWELVPPKIVESMDTWRIWLLFDPRILWTMDAIRVLYGKPITVNDWKTGGVLTMRGFRPENVNLVPGVLVDQHKYGRAIDFNVAGKSAEEINEDIIKNPARNEYQFITGLEVKKSWTHIDCRNFDKGANGGRPMTF